MKLTVEKFNEIRKSLDKLKDKQIPDATKLSLINEAQAELNKLSKEQNAGVEVTQVFDEKQSITDIIINAYTDATAEDLMSPAIRAALRENVIDPLVKILCDTQKIDTYRGRDGQPLLHSIVYFPPRSRGDLEAIEKLLSIFYRYGANFNVAGQNNNTPAHTVVYNWQSPDGKRLAPDMLDILFKFGAGFNRENRDRLTVADMVKKENEAVVAKVKDLGGRKRSELDVNDQALREQADKLTRYEDRTSVTYEWSKHVYSDFERAASEHVNIVKDRAGPTISSNALLHMIGHTKVGKEIVSSYAKVNEPRPTAAGGNAGHQWMSFPLPQEAASISGKVPRVLDDMAKFEFGEFCSHGLSLTMVDDQKRTVLDLMESRGLTDDLLQNPAVRTAVQSQFDHVKVQPILKRVAAAKEHIAGKIPNSDVVPYRNDAEIAALSEQDKKKIIADAWKATKLNLQPTFLLNAGGMGVKGWEEFKAQHYDRETKPAMKNKMHGYLAKLLNEYYSLLDDAKKVQFCARLPVEFKSLVKQSPVPVSVSAHQSTMYGGAAAKDVKAEPPADVAAVRPPVK